MKYLNIILIFLLSAFLFIVLNFYNNGWQYLQPFLIAVLLVYFNIENPWIYYSFALLSGLFIDSFSAIFGLHSFLFIFIIWLLKSLQLTIFTSKNILTIILLTFFAFLFFWSVFWLLNLFDFWQLYIFDKEILWQIVKMGIINILAVIIIHLLHYNLWVKNHEPR